jgi:CheY-like chemotaxis protein
MNKKAIMGPFIINTVDDALFSRKDRECAHPETERYGVGLEHGTGEHGTVYLIDDDSSVRRAMKRLFRAEGLKVVDYASADAFLANRPKEDRACLVLDVDMPGTDGIELQQILNAGGSRLPLVFITAINDPQIHEKALSAGALNLNHAGEE